MKVVLGSVCACVTEIIIIGHETWKIMPSSRAKQNTATTKANCFYCLANRKCYFINCLFLFSQTTDSAPEVVNASTKAPLTGNPQIDWVWDPNLPRELNGFNLSNYPFLNSIPEREDIGFECKGLHDGFYASVKFGCQVSS